MPDIIKHPKRLVLIAAVAENGVIGSNNELPWHLPADLKYFKQMTLGKPIIMGRKTWDSLGRPLPGRENIVISRQKDLKLEGAEVLETFEEALKWAREWADRNDSSDVMVIGGAQLYAQAIDQADHICLTRVFTTPDGDAWFPALEAGQWALMKQPTLNPATDTTPAYQFEDWYRVP